MNMKITALFFCTICASQCVHSDQRVTLGVKLLSSTWEGNNGAGGSSFKSTEGGQLGFNASYQVDKFYTGVSLQGGDYTFGNTSPDQFTTSGRVSSSNEKIEQGELDLIVGYYFWPRVSLFLDLKGVGSSWINSNHTQGYGGIGLGVTTYAPLENNLTIFSSFGFVSNGTVKDDDDNEVGDGNSTALEVGLVYALDEKNHFNTGFKLRNYDFEYLDGSKQEYSVNTLFFGYSYNFYLN